MHLGVEHATPGAAGDGSGGRWSGAGGAGRGSGARRHRAGARGVPRLHRDRFLCQVAGAARAADLRGRLRALRGAPRDRAGDRLRDRRAAVGDGEPRGAEPAGGGVARQHAAELRRGLLPAADHHLGADVLGAALDLPAVDPAARRGGRLAALDRHAGRLLRHPDRRTAMDRRAALGGVSVARRGALRVVLRHPDATARRARQHQHPAVLRRADRHGGDGAAGAPRLEMADGRRELDGTGADRRLRLGRTPAADHRAPLCACLDAGALQLRADRLYDGLELADLRPAAGPLGDRRRGGGGGERPLHLAEGGALVARGRKR